MATCPECRVRYEDDVSECPADGSGLLPDEAFATADPPLEPGTMVGEYKIERKLGAGTFGDVYAGEQPLIGKRVAIKVLNRKFAADPEVVSRFIAEARAVNRIQHRNIIDIFSFGVLNEQQHYFVMELLDGLSLQDLMDREKRLSVRQAIPILRGIAAALDAAHEANITHRDLKPDNVYLAIEKDGSYSPKLLDFGVAKLAADDVTHRTATGIAIGTPSYMSPEQSRGKKVGPPADIYALGIVIHEMLTGALPFDADTAMDMLFMHATEPPPSMSSVYVRLPAELDEPVLAMLAKRPKARPKTATEAIDAFAKRARELGLDEAHTTQPDAVVRSDPPADSAAATVKDGAAPLSTGAVSTNEVAVPPSSSASTMLKVEAPASSTARSAGVPSKPPDSDQPVRSSGAAPAASEINSTLEGMQATGDGEDDPAKPRQMWLLATAAAAVLLLGGLVWLEPWASPQTIGDAATGSTASVSTSLSAQVTLTFSVSPDGADVFVGKNHRGSASDPLRLVRSKDAVDIRFEKAGYHSRVVSIVPDRDQKVAAVTLKLKDAASTASASSTASTPAPTTRTRRPTPTPRTVPPGTTAKSPTSYNKALDWGKGNQ